MSGELPPLPDGYTLDKPASGLAAGELPPLPDGYTLDAPATAETTLAATPAQAAASAAGPAAFDPSQADTRNDVQRAADEQLAQHPTLDRFMTGFTKPLVGGIQLAAHLLPGASTAGPDQAARNVALSEQQARTNAGLKPEDTDWVGMAGQLASPINYAVPGPGAGAGLGRAVLGRAAQGAALGALEPASGEDYAGTKLGQAALGAVAGGVSEPLMRGAAAVISPLMSRPIGARAASSVPGAARVPEEQYADAAKRLIEAGVPLTGGQTSGGAGRWLEEVSGSIPGFGGAVREAQGHAAVEGFNRAAANEVLAPLGERVPANIEAGHDLFNYMADRIGAEYDRIHPQVTLRADGQLWHDIGQVWQQSGSWLPAQQRQQLASIIDTQLNGKLIAGGGTMPGELLQTVTSELGRATKNYRTDPSADVRMLGDYLGELRPASMLSFVDGLIWPEVLIELELIAAR